MSFNSISRTKHRHAARRGGAKTANKPGETPAPEWVTVRRQGGAKLPPLRGEKGLFGSPNTRGGDARTAEKKTAGKELSLRRISRNAKRPNLSAF